MIDANGSELADGNEVQFKFPDGSSTSYWQEKEGKIQRDRTKGSTFKVKKAKKGNSL